MAAELHIASQFRHMPSREEVRRIDKDWIRQVGELTAMIMSAQPTTESTDEE